MPPGGVAQTPAAAGTPALDTVAGVSASSPAVTSPPRVKATSTTLSPRQGNPSPRDPCAAASSNSGNNGGNSGNVVKAKSPCTSPPHVDSPSLSRVAGAMEMSSPPRVAADAQQRNRQCGGGDVGGAVVPVGATTSVAAVAAVPPPGSASHALVVSPVVVVRRRPSGAAAGPDAVAAALTRGHNGPGVGVNRAAGPSLLSRALGDLTKHRSRDTAVPPTAAAPTSSQPPVGSSVAHSVQSSESVAGAEGDVTALCSPRRASELEGVPTSSRLDGEGDMETADIKGRRHGGASVAVQALQAQPVHAKADKKPLQEPSEGHDSGRTTTDKPSVEAKQFRVAVIKFIKSTLHALVDGKGPSGGMAVSKDDFGRIVRQVEELFTEQPDLALARGVDVTREQQFVLASMVKGMVDGIASGRLMA